MVVYADMLVLLNLIVDYFLLALTARLTKSDPRLWRLIAAAFAGGLSSLTLFLPVSGVAESAALRLAAAAAMTGICFGFRGAKRFFRTLAVLFAVSGVYAGVLFGLWQLFHPHGMVVRGGVVYFNISPLFLIGFSVAGYLLYLLLHAMLGRNAVRAKACQVEVFADGRSTRFNAIVDTGNSLEDVFGVSEIIIADEKTVRGLFGDFRQDESLKRRYRTLPCSTVSGDGLLDGYRCDRAVVTCAGRTTALTRPVLAISKTAMGGDYSAVINPKALE